MQNILGIPESTSKVFVYRCLQVVPLELDPMLVGLVIRQIPNAVEIARYVEPIEEHQIPVCLIQHVLDDVMPDEPGTASDEDAFRVGCGSLLSSLLHACSYSTMGGAWRQS